MTILRNILAIPVIVVAFELAVAGMIAHAVVGVLKGEQE